VWTSVAACGTSRFDGLLKVIVPALATHRTRRGRLAACYALGAGGYALGLWASAVFDLPSGAVTVWAMAALAIVVFALGSRREQPAR